MASTPKKPRWIHALHCSSSFLKPLFKVFHQNVLYHPEHSFNQYIAMTSQLGNFYCIAEVQNFRRTGFPAIIHN